MPEDRLEDDVPVKRGSRRWLATFYGGTGADVCVLRPTDIGTATPAASTVLRSSTTLDVAPLDQMAQVSSAVFTERSYAAMWFDLGLAWEPVWPVSVDKHGIRLYLVRES